jgi:hypothetical protein
MNPAINSSHWPGPLDAALLVGFLAAILSVTVLGYVFMVLDFRAYLRSLRRAVVCIVRYFPDLPEWARAETPRCILAFGLQMPCSEDELKQVYRHRVKDLHPDRGGDQRRFQALQRHFEDALRYLGQQRAAAA